MKKRDPVVTTILSLLVPFYALYWFYDTGNGLKARGTPNVPAFKMILIPVVAILGAYLFLIIGSAADVSIIKAIAFLVLIPAYIAAIVMPLMYYYKFGAATETATNKQLNGALLFVLFWLLAPAGIYLTQEKLNATDGQAAGPAAPSAPQAPPTSFQPPQPPQPPAAPTV